MPTSFEIPDDPVALRMENDLLALQAEHLRGQVRSMRKRAERAERADEVQALRAQLEDERGRAEEAAKARSDLRWLLERLEGSPARLLLRRFDGYQVLLDRWLGK